MAKQTLTPREIFIAVQKLTEDGIFIEDDFIEYFNNSVDEVNADIGTNFPRINSGEMDIEYPNITIEPKYNIKGSYSGLESPKNITGIKSYNYDTWIQFLKLQAIDTNITSSVFCVYQINGGDLVKGLPKQDKNIYRIVISYTFKDGQFLLQDTSKAFSIFRLSSGPTPLTFGFQQEGNTLNLYVNPTTSPQQLLTPITVSSYIDNSVDNIELVDDIIVTDIMPPGYIGLDYYRRKYSLHAKWCNKLFIPIIIKTIRLYEGDTAELISLEQQVSSKSLNSFRNEVRKTLPLILYNPKKKYGDDN